MRTASKIVEKIRNIISEKLHNVRIYCQMTDITSISRRYFVIGFFDGVLTILGMVMGAYLSGKSSPEIVLTAGVATALALGISSGWGAYEAERVEQTLEADEKRRMLLTDTKGCAIDRAHAFATYVSSIVHAIAPIPAAVVPLLPYLFLPPDEAIKATMLIGFSLLFLVGIMMGRIARRNILISGFRMVVAGLLTLALVTLLSPSHVV